jgi:cytochrome b561
MGDKNGGESYNAVAKSLHWVICGLFTVMFILGFGLMVSDGYTAFGAQWGPVFDWHATLGLIVLVLAIFRLWWRNHAPLPSWAPGLSSGERKLAHWTEMVLYTVMIAKPISGYIMAGVAGYNIDLFVSGPRIGNPFGNPPTGQRADAGFLYDLALIVHIVTGIAFLVVFVVHAGQALRHQFIKKDHLLERMLPGSG